MATMATVDYEGIYSMVGAYKEAQAMYDLEPHPSATDAEKKRWLVSKVMRILKGQARPDQVAAMIDAYVDGTLLL